jgi:hypothetical protein
MRNDYKATYLNILGSTLLRILAKVEEDNLFVEQAIDFINAY